MNKNLDPREVYERFNSIHLDTHQQLVHALLLQDMQPKEFFGGVSLATGSYDELVGALVSYLRERKVPESTDFEDKLYWAFKPEPKGSHRLREPLLEIMYGRIWGDEVPDEIFRNFTDEWEAGYFLSGIRLSRVSEFRGHRFEEKDLLAWRVPEIVARTMDRGISRLNKYESQLKKTLPHKPEVEQVIKYILDPKREQLVLDGIVL